MQVLENKWERRLAPITVWPSFADRACRRIKKERTIISFAVVVTGGAKSERRPENQYRGRERPPAWPNQRRVKRRKVRTPFVVTIFKCPPRRIDAERSKHDDDRDQLQPPRIAARSRAKTGAGNCGPGFGHQDTGGSLANERVARLSFRWSKFLRMADSLWETPYSSKLNQHQVVGHLQHLKTNPIPIQNRER